MNRHEELTGTFILVNPELPNDPARKQNHIGIITAVEIEDDNIYVSFGKDGQGLYSADALLILRTNGPNFSSNEMDHITHIDTDILVDVIHVSLLAGSPSAKDRLEGVEFVRDYDTIRKYCTVSLKEHLTNRQYYDMGR